MRRLQEEENKMQWGAGWLFAPSCSCRAGVGNAKWPRFYSQGLLATKRATVARFTYGEDHSTNSQMSAKKTCHRGTCRQRGDASITKCKTLEGNGASSAGKLVANMASFLSPAAKVNTEQRPSKTATKATKATGKICLSDFFEICLSVVSSCVMILSKNK